MSDIQGLEYQLDNARKAKEQRDKVLKLISYPEFRELITEGFCRDEAARYVHVSTDPALSPQDRADALAAAQAAGHLKRWLHALLRMGDQAEKDIPDLHEAIEYARAEEEAGE